MADVYQAFAHAFKKPPSSTEAFYFEVSLEIRENQDLNQDQGTQPGGHESAAAANYDSVPRQKNMFKLKKDVDKKVVITVSQISKVGYQSCQKGNNLAKRVIFVCVWDHRVPGIFVTLLHELAGLNFR